VKHSFGYEPTGIGQDKQLDHVNDARAQRYSTGHDARSPLKASRRSVLRNGAKPTCVKNDQKKGVTVRSDGLMRAGATLEQYLGIGYAKDYWLYHIGV
jgi:hypothetical protein